MKNILTAESIILDLGSRRILSDIYLKIETGQIVGLLGRNGAGKSSLMKIIFGTLEPLQKTIHINDKSSLKAFTKTDTINYLPQFNCFPANRSITSLFQDFKVDFQEFERRFPAMIQRRTQIFDQLSGGNQRFIQTYIFLFTPGMFVLLDEPFSNLSPLMITAMCGLIKEVSHFKGILLSDHYYKNVLDISDLIFVLQEGRLKRIQSGTDLYTAGYISQN